MTAASDPLSRTGRAGRRAAGLLASPGLLVGLFVVACSAQPGQPSATRPWSSSSPDFLHRATTSAAAPRSSDSPPPPRHPSQWRFHVVVRGRFDAQTKIQVSGHRAFVVVGNRLEAISLANGRVLARRSVPGAVRDADVVDGRLWVSVRYHQDLIVSQYTTALRRVVQTTLGTAADVGAPQGLMASAPDSRSVLVSDGARLFAVSATTDQVADVDFVTPPGEIDDLASLGTGPDRIAIGHSGEHGGRLDVFHLGNSRASLVATAVLGAQVEEGGVQGIAGSPARVYVVAGLGHAVPVITYKVRDAKLDGVGTDNSLMQYAEVDYGDHELWIGGLDRLACADARTGHEAGSTRLVRIAKQGVISTLTTSRGKVVALVRYGGRDGSALVVVKPPAGCRS